MVKPAHLRVKTAETSFRIIEILHESGPMVPSEIEERLSLATSTVYRHLATLCDTGYVCKDGKDYRLSFKFLSIGGALRRDTTAYPMIKEKVDELARETDERAQFLVREGHERIYLYTEIGTNLVQTGAQTGKRGPIHSSAAGKTIIANLPEQQREHLLEAMDLVQTGPNTITDPDELRAELETIREQGYALNLQESTVGVHAVGAPVLCEDEGVVGAISVAGPASRLGTDRMEGKLLELLLGTTNELELHIAHG